MNHCPFSRILAISLTTLFLALHASAESEDALFAEVPQEQPVSTTTTMLPLSGDTISSFGFPEDNSSFTKDFAMEEPKRKTIQFSLRGGIHDWVDSTVDSSYGIQGEILYSVPNLPIDIDVRAYYASVEYEPAYYFGSLSSRDYLLIYRTSYACREDLEQEGYGGSAQIRWNFDKGAVINPYISGGAIYEKSKVTCDGFLIVDTNDTGLWTGNRYKTRNTYTYKDSSDEDGISWIARLGLEGTLYPVYLRLELSALGEIYDSDSVQAEILAMVGVNLTDHIRFEVAGDYFTDWEEYYITAGLSVGF
ncbi:MAG: hypothetical protein ACI4QT_02250 [Kiritimatiellia bacterium]